MKNNNKEQNIIKRIREKYKLKQVDLAKILGVTKATVSHWESNAGISTEYLYEISKLFSIPIDTLIKTDEYNEPDELKMILEDISNINIDEIINKKQYDLFKRICENILFIKQRICYLLEMWAFDIINKEEIEQLKQLKDYFNISDIQDEFYLFEYIVINKINKLKKEIIKLFLNLEKTEEKQYELIKKFDLKFKFEIKNIFEINDLNIINGYMNSLFQFEKDELLAEYMYIEHNKNLYLDDEADRKMYINFLEMLPSSKDSFELYLKQFLGDSKVKVLINNNCNILLPENVFEQTYIYNFPLICFPGEYKKMEIEDYEYEYKISSYKDYQKVINNKYTKYFKTMLNNREDNPLQYYYDLLEIFKL